MRKVHRQGFTLIELLVVVSIIALLVSILLPALAEARRQGKLALDQANLHQIGLSLIMYADENNNDFPRSSHWMGPLFDVTYKTTNYIIATGGDKHTFYCPLEGVKNPDEDIFWRAAECFFANQPDLGNTPEPENYIRPDGYEYYELLGRVTGYFWLFDLADKSKKAYPTLRPSPFKGTPARTWVTKSTQRDASDTEFVVDITLSTSMDPDNASFTDFSWGLDGAWGVKDKTAHVTKDMKARDGNNLYVDGHVARKPFEDMQMRINMYTYSWW